MNFINDNNKTYYAILIFLTCIFLIHHIKPSLIYDDDGSFKKFGVGYQKFTVIPMWFAVIILAILSYIAVFYYTLIPRIKY